MQDAELVLDFAVQLGKKLLVSGANIERAALTIEVICKTYGLQDVSVSAQSSIITVGAKETADGDYFMRQVNVPPAKINLERLKRLNNLSYEIPERHPAPSELFSLLAEAENSKTYPMSVVLGGFLLAMACLCRIFGGVWQDILVTELNTVMLFFLTMGLGKLHLNRVITNPLCMFLCGATTFGFIYLGFAQNFYVIIITNAFYLIPGIPMVNSVRNILCGNEMNGILELLKVVMEVVTIVAGVAMAFFCFGGDYGVMLEDPIEKATGIWADIELVFISLLASVGFGIVFEIRPKDLVFAGMGGTIIRIVYIILLNFVPYRIVYMTLAAFSAALFAEILAYTKKTPSTVYLYPSIVPIIPGDLIYYSMLGIVWNNKELFNANAGECLLALTGISVGFVLCSTLVHHVRKIKFRNLFKIVHSKH